MESCPSELWTRIFSLACIDDGSTGRAVAQVSKYFYETSSPVQLQSVALTGPQMIIRFANALPLFPPERRMRNLFVSTQRPDATTPPKDHGSQADGHVSRRQMVEDVVAEKTLVIDAMRLILDAAARSVSNLSIAFTYGMNLIPFPPNLPTLRYLMICGPPLSLSFHGKRPVFHSLPALEYLHLSGCEFDVFHDIWDVAPILSHLRLSGLTRLTLPLSPMFLQRIVRSKLQPGASIIHEATMSITAMQRPELQGRAEEHAPNRSRLKTIFFQAAPPPRTSDGIQLRMLNPGRHFPQQLQELQMQDVDVVILPPPPVPVDAANWTNARTEWQEVNEGCSTCWDKEKSWVPPDSSWKALGRTGTSRRALEL